MKGGWTQFVSFLMFPMVLGAVTFPPRPGPRQFVVDEAGLLSPAAETQLRRDLDLLLRQTAVPVLVVTLPSLAAYGAGDWSIEAYASALYNRWGIGHRVIREEDGTLREWNRGVLLLVAVGDRKVRIELGAGFGHDYDARARQILDRHVLPHFREGRYEQGILEGVEALGRMVRGDVGVEGEVPARGESGWMGWVVAAIAVLAMLWAVFGPSRRRGPDESQSFDGGSFGGGTSGGGGATGEW